MVPETRVNGLTKREVADRGLRDLMRKVGFNDVNGGVL